MRSTILVVCAVLLIAGREGRAEAAPRPAGLWVVYAVTATGQTPPVTSIYAHEIGSGARHLAYRDSDQPNRVLVKIASSDVLGAARAVPPKDIYLMMGPAAADAAAAKDALCRLRLIAAAEAYAPEPLFPVPLCFSEASPYGMWNRAPIFAVSGDGNRVALAALRVGQTRLERPAIRLLSAEGKEQWQILLEDRDLYVADLAWSPDGNSLAYLVMPLGDEHTLEERLLPKAGLYLADTEARSVHLFYHCYGDALAWAPQTNRIAVAARAGDFWGERWLVRLLALPSGDKVEEFSAPGSISALAYSDDGEWLAVQVMHKNRQQIWLYPTAGDWGHLFFEPPEGEGRLSLLGWARGGPE